MSDDHVVRMGARVLAVEAADVGGWLLTLVEYLRTYRRPIPGICERWAPCSAPSPRVSGPAVTG
jgi:hypothetical protein